MYCRGFFVLRRNISSGLFSIQRYSRGLDNNHGFKVNSNCSYETCRSSFLSQALPQPMLHESYSDGQHHNSVYTEWKVEMSLIHPSSERATPSTSTGFESVFGLRSGFRWAAHGRFGVYHSQISRIAIHRLLDMEWLVGLSGTRTKHDSRCCRRLRRSPTDDGFFFGPQGHFTMSGGRFGFMNHTLQKWLCM